MNDQWDRERSLQFALDRKQLADIHTAVCGNNELGVPGLVATVKQHGDQILSLESTRNNGLVLGKASSIVVGFVVSLSFIGCFFVAIYEALKGK